jgi:hypothetical protein
MHAHGLTPRAVLEKLAGIQMLDVSFPTTDGRRLVMPRYTEPSPEQALSLCANMTETPCMTAISEGGKENQHGNDERFFPARSRCDGSI